MMLSLWRYGDFKSELCKPITKRAKTVLGDTKRPNTTKDVSSEKWRKVNWTNIY